MTKVAASAAQRSRRPGAGEWTQLRCRREAREGLHDLARRANMPLTRVLQVLARTVSVRTVVRGEAALAREEREAQDHHAA